MSAEERAGAFQTKPLAARAAIVAAGPIANFLLAIVIFTLTYTIMGMHVTAPRVDELLPDSAAATAGFKVGDVILRIDGQAIDTFADMQRIVSGSADRQLSVDVDRGGTVVALKVTPTRRELVDRFGNKMRVGQIGIRRNATQHEWEYRRYGPAEAFVLGVKETFFIITRTLQFLQELVMGRESTDQLRGPIGIAEISGQVATLGIMPLLNLVALISVSIGLINLFPIPLLDGGHLLFYGIEAVRRKPLSERTQEISFRIGLAIVLMLTIFVTWKDIVRSWLGGVG
jgi:regulator of sigma E protease